MAYQHPIATIANSYEDGGILRTTLTLNSIPSSPIAPASLYEQDKVGVKVLDLHQLVERTEKILTFETYHGYETPLTTSSRFQFISWWRPDQLKLAQDTAQHWYKRPFTSQDMVLVNVLGKQMGRRVMAEETFVNKEVLVKDGWEHEHCFLCWETISAHEENSNEGYTNGKDWLCETCYVTYIVSGFSKKLGEALQSK